MSPEPGGYLQFTEADGLSNRFVQRHRHDDHTGSKEGKDMILPPSELGKLNHLTDVMCAPKPNLDYRWISHLDAHFSAAGLTNVHLSRHESEKSFDASQNRLRLMTYEETVEGISRQGGKKTDGKGSEEGETLLEELYVELQTKGVVFTFDYVTAVGRRGKPP